MKAASGLTAHDATPHWIGKARKLIVRISITRRRNSNSPVSIDTSFVRAAILQDQIINRGIPASNSPTALTAIAIRTKAHSNRGAIHATPQPRGRNRASPLRLITRRRTSHSKASTLVFHASVVTKPAISKLQSRTTLAPIATSQIRIMGNLQNAPTTESARVAIPFKAGRPQRSR